MVVPHDPVDEGGGAGGDGPPGGREFLAERVPLLRPVEGVEGEFLQEVEDPPLHLARRLVGEGDGENGAELLPRLHQETEVSRGEGVGLPRARRRLDDPDLGETGIGSRRTVRVPFRHRVPPGSGHYTRIPRGRTGRAVRSNTADRSGRAAQLPS